ncbi:response regulator [Erythrobacter arachoides]|uniref:Response regulator n=1 Tax=Aurantiacibacter arachoides TaxID=1850444 RepID=A0A845A2K8_9SPHN|nr:response regulator [Aurantiacibacter arachoides]MXO94375.1 response regulator [Aurantiacibacter arachoides]GGD63956.1 hypothetical protein GCM10011411_25320 [Aurantiacibacter arachoides]
MQSAQAIVLVVEDEVLIRMDVVDQLSALGYSIIEACNGREALEVAQQYEAIDILFTDIDMPGDVDGLTLAHEIRASRPEIGIIVTSGKPLLGEARLPEGSRFYPKPYLSTTVHATIQEMVMRPG